ncbi:glycosyl hydrolase [Streptomyces sp. KS 21]|uniref:glycoside hydrolase family 26 protein n=1 Tax=Streptomyces sp. KS 21 TaxID=2485150 RepID=UPI0010643158|nr:glycosyl hydrolase [Streptomyces sp. KS 21]TDU77724.1 glycosyl hydrolase family 26 [Streptomyces sp. KS 21]
MPRPHRRLASTCIGTVTAGLLATGAALAAPEREQPKGSDIAMGAFLDSGPPGVARIPNLSRWLGGKEIRVGHTYLPGDRWARIEGPDFLEPWAEWRRAKADRLFVLNVPMQERNEDRVPDRKVAQLIRAGAKGEFDRHFEKLARRLVELGVPDTVIVLGWEMNGATYTHRCAPDPEGWKEYWRRIVNAMRSVPGAEFKFDYAPNRGSDAIGWTNCYPGDDVVDIVGMDSYDQAPGKTFDEMVKQPYGLQQHVDFAKAHGKEISYPEWGLFRHGDNAEYVRRMLKWIEQHKPLYHTITDYCPHGVWQCKQNPKSAKAFRAALAPQRPDPVPTPVVPTPVIPTPVVPTPVVPTPVVPTPVIPTPAVPSPQIPTPEIPVPSPAIPSPEIPEIPQIPSPQVPLPVPVPVPSPEIPGTSPSPEPVPEPSPAVPSPETPVDPSPDPVPVPVPSPEIPNPVPSPEVPVPSPVPSPVVPKPEPPEPPANSTEWCVPINFGEWLSKLVGRQSVCIKINWGKDSGFWPW